MLWWYGITWLVNKLRKRFNVRSMWFVNRIIAIILFVMGIIGITLALIDILKV